MSERTHTNIRHIAWSILVIGICVLVAFLATQAAARASVVLNEVSTNQVAQVNQVSETEEKNEDAYYMVGNPEAPSLQTDAYLVADLETGQILLRKNHTRIYPIASVTKLITAIVAQETLPQNANTVISEKTLATEGWRGQFEVGQKISIGELLYPLLLVSSNDAGEAIARFKGRDNFIEDMNETARAIGLTKTKFEDPTGLSDGNVSTAEELLILLKHMYENEQDILEMSREDYYSAEKQVWENKNKLAHEETFMGGKTGFTNAAKQTSAGVYEITLVGDVTRPIGIVMLHSSNREVEIRKIIEYLENYLHYGNERTLKGLSI